MIGDITDDDVVDTADWDPGAVAHIYHELLREITGDETRKHFEELSEVEKWVVALAFARLLSRLKREKKDG